MRLKSDWVLVITVAVLAALGLVMVYSASALAAGSSLLVRQLIWCAISIGVMSYLRRLDYRRLYSPQWAFLPISISLVLLIIVYVLDSKNHRWLRIGWFGLQPSEFAKPALVLFLAYLIARSDADVNSRRFLKPALLVTGVLAALVVAADLGTAIVLVATAAVLLFAAGLDRTNLKRMAAVCVLLAALATISKPYRLGRIIAFIDPDGKLIAMIDKSGKINTYVHRAASAHDPSYQVLQSKIAVGSGGLYGLGLGNGSQKNSYLPEAHSDFIYAVIGEELGLAGTSGVLLGFGIILWRGLRLVWLAHDDYGRFLAIGLTAAIVIQAFFNISVVLGIAPTKGIPLPLISQGGSSLCSTMASFGILLSVGEHAG